MYTEMIRCVGEEDSARELGFKNKVEPYMVYYTIYGLETLVRLLMRE